LNEEFLKKIKGISWDSLDAKSAVELRAALKEALAQADEWFTQLADGFGYPVPSLSLPARVANGRPPALAPPTTTEPQPVPNAGKAVTPARRPRGRPLKKVNIRLRKSADQPQQARPEPLSVGGADAEGTGPQGARLFENSYVSKDGPRADIAASLPVDHPRRSLNRESSVTPEVDMSDFHLVEEAVRHGKSLKDTFN